MTPLEIQAHSESLALFPGQCCFFGSHDQQLRLQLKKLTPSLSHRLEIPKHLVSMVVTLTPVMVHSLDEPLLARKLHRLPHSPDSPLHH